MSTSFDDVTEEDADLLAEQVSREIISFFPWNEMRFTEAQKEVYQQNIRRIAKRVVRNFVGKPLQPIRMRSPRASKPSKT